MISRRTGERFKGIYCIDNEYIPEVLDEINFVMRDWRRNETKAIDRRTIDIIAASHNLLNTDEPYTLCQVTEVPKQMLCLDDDQD